jgi:outer membrane receptor protein involved in Fe transport
LTFDYYNIWIYDAITYLGAADILRNCYIIEGYDEYCDLITRNPDTGQVSNIDTSVRNVGELKTSGFDFTLNLGFPIFQNIRGNLSFQGNILLSLRERDPDAAAAGEEGADVYYTGDISPAGGGDPEFRFISGISIGNKTWTLDNRVRYIHGMTILDAAEGAPYTSVPAVAYWDIAAGLNVGDFNIAIGMDNVLDKVPPYLPGSHYNGNISMYDTIGRYMWTRLNYHFH